MPPDSGRLTAGASPTASPAAGLTPAGEAAAIDVIRDYTEAVFRRAREPMEPLNFDINWGDQPSRHTTYPDAQRVPLPAAIPTLPTLRQLLAGQELPSPGSWSLDRVATLLRLSYGVLDRRLVVNWNQDIAKRVHFPYAVWGRGTASGGGMYPVEVYLVAGPSGPLLPGIYHYATGHHALHRLLTGDVTPLVRAALGTDGAGDQFLLATVKFWKNSFKYNSFCYHVVTQDLGAMLGSWDLLGRAIGAPVRRHLSFDVAALDGLLGLDSDAESVFAVVPLPWEGTATGETATGTTATGTAAGITGTGTTAVPGSLVKPDAAPRVTHTAFERSRAVLSFPQVTRVHRAAMRATTPAVDAVSAATPADLTGTAVPLPPPELDRLDRPLSTVLRSRGSSFGRFRRPPELTAAELGTTLAVAAAGRHYAADVKPPGGEPAGSEPTGSTAGGPAPGNAPAGGAAPGRGPALTRLWVFANHVDGLAPGTYAYRERDHSLLPARPSPQPDMSSFLQQQYFLTNYTMSQVGAVLAVSGRLDAVLAAFGPRGYRILNAEVGTVAQVAYCASAALGVGCGAVLGFDNVAMNEALGIDGTDERTVLFLLLGRQPAVAADLSYHLW
jgi:SagB-type dehydrogenase family enzyme